jgi:hypothetical protein
MSTPFAKKIPGHAGAGGGGGGGGKPAQAQQQCISFSMQSASLVNKGFQSIMIFIRHLRRRDQCRNDAPKRGLQPDKLL